MRAGLFRAEGHIRAGVVASRNETLRGRRPHARTEALCTGTGRSAGRSPFVERRDASGRPRPQADDERPAEVGPIRSTSEAVATIYDGHLNANVSLLRSFLSWTRQSLRRRSKTWLQSRGGVTSSTKITGPRVSVALRAQVQMAVQQWPGRRRRGSASLRVTSWTSDSGVHGTSSPLGCKE